MFCDVVELQEYLFLNKFILRFSNNAKGLLVAIKEHLLHSSEETDTACISC